MSHHPTNDGLPLGADILRRRSSASRSFVLASLRALHLDSSHAVGQAAPKRTNPSPPTPDQRAHALFVMTPAQGVVVPLIAST